MALLSPEQFATRFSSFVESAFRLELLDHYVAGNEAEPLRAYLAGEGPSAEWREPWKRFVRGKLRSGATMARVHVVTEPLTDYVRFELTCAYPASVEAGEDVRILPRHHTTDLELPVQDFWLLDSSHVGLLHYDTHGNWLSVDFTDEPEVLDRSCRAREVAMARAVPLTDYLDQAEPSREETAHGCAHYRAS